MPNWYVVWWVVVGALVLAYLVAITVSALLNRRGWERYFQKAKPHVGAASSEAALERARREEERALRIRVEELDFERSMAELKLKLKQIDHLMKVKKLMKGKSRHANRVRWVR